MAFDTLFYSATHDRTQFDHHVPAPLFRTVVQVDDPDEVGLLDLSGLGFYELWLNGTNITKGYLAPYISNPDDIVYYDRYDLRPLLRSGQNVLVVILGNGFQNNIDTAWQFNLGKHNGAPRFACSWELEDRTLTAKDFVWHPSPITFDNYRCGTHYDARLEISDLWDPELDMTEWNPVVRAESPRGERRLCEADPIRIQREIQAISIKPGELVPYVNDGDVDRALGDVQVIPNPTDEKKGFIYDFGINTTGIFRLTIKGEPGQRIVVDYAERLTDGKVDPTNINFLYPDGYGQRDTYICKGEGSETFIPSFTYHGGRYLYVSGLTEEQATKDAIVYLEMHSDLGKRATFICSDETVNTLWTMAQRSDLSNFYYFPTDCPHREKNGWTGDVSISAEHMLMTLEAEKSFTEWLRNVCAAQDARGVLPGIVPTTGWGFAWGNGPAWDSVLFELPYQIYIYTGHTEAMAEASPHMLRYLDHVAQKRDSEGILTHGLGDWCPIGRSEGDYLVPVGLTSSIMVYQMCQKAKFMFEKLGQSLNASYAQTLGQELRQAIRAKYLDPQTMRLAANSQTAQAMGMYFGIYEPSEIPTAYALLVEMIKANGCSMDVGFLGARVMFHVLSMHGDTDLALHLITKPEYPSYGNIIERGGTSLWEMFYPDRPPRSENHHFWGDVSHWFLRQLAGIQVNPTKHNPNHIVLTPHFAEKLDWVEATYQAPAGELSVQWKKQGDLVEVTLDVPETLCVDLNLPYNIILEEGRSYKEAIGSGTYVVRAMGSQN